MTRAVETVAAVREWVRDWRRRELRIAFVPTMGNLHAGHLALVDAARALGDRVVVSIFVNPTQFAPGEDYASYPRTLAEDAAALDGRCDLLFAPSAEEIYPEGLQGHTRVMVPEVSAGLCGERRPGHFEGVATVVCKLLSITAPDVAVFGEKDYQQLLVVRKLVADLNFPVAIHSVPTVREPDGLAMSSRNRYLDAQQRSRAGALYAALCEVRDQVNGGGSPEVALSTARQRLETAGMDVEYVELRRAEDLGTDLDGAGRLVVLAAVRLGSARLIDNLSFARDVV